MGDRFGSVSWAEEEAEAEEEEEEAEEEEEEAEEEEEREDTDLGNLCACRKTNKDARTRSLSPGSLRLPCLRCVRRYCYACYLLLNSCCGTTTPAIYYSTATMGLQRLLPITQHLLGNCYACFFTQHLLRHATLTIHTRERARARERERERARARERAREREKERARARGREGEGEREREGGREGGRERERERGRESERDL